MGEFYKARDFTSRTLLCERAMLWGATKLTVRITRRSREVGEPKHAKHVTTRLRVALLLSAISLEELDRAVIATPR